MLIGEAGREQSPKVEQNETCDFHWGCKFFNIPGAYAWAWTEAVRSDKTGKEAGVVLKRSSGCG